ncbi:MAG: hypothetical protein HYS86_04980 [Candidatus Chisholmbacteria bacterium]|nr:hypothetical protein [Candidatus Chisholmbacteria bacterium]
MALVNLDQINQAGGIRANVRSLPGIVSVFVDIALPLAGLILLGIIILAGFQILTGASNPDQVEKGKKTLTQGVIGFVIVFSAYWIAQILEVLFAFPIVNN